MGRDDLRPEDLVTELGSVEPRARRVASERLRHLGQAALEELIHGARHPDRLVRVESVALLDHLADDRCVGVLAQALNDRSPHVRRHAVHSIGCQPCKRYPLDLDAVALLIERALRDPSIRVRRVATHQLGLQPRDARAMQALERILREDRDAKLRARARWALAAQRGAPRALLSRSGSAG